MRNLAAVLTKMIDVIPESEGELIIALEEEKRQSYLRAPEDKGGWSAVHTILVEEIGHPTDTWQWDLLGIWTGRSYEDLKAHLEPED
jgi:hypothetical protein